MIKHINEADAVVGCVAWLTSEPILKALAKKKTSIIVQKEDFLRPDMDYQNGWKTRLHELYSNLGGLARFEVGGTVLRTMSYLGEQSIDGVRCVGNNNNDRAPAFPRMHNKFIIFCEYIPPCTEEYYGLIQPYAVWTGSFNFTKNGGRSLENALYVTQPEIFNAYYQEYAQIAALSESLDWECDWVKPEWRIGT